MITKSQKRGIYGYILPKLSEKIFEIDESIIRLARDVENEIRDIARDIESVREINQYKVIAAMQEHRLSDSHFGGLPAMAIMTGQGKCSRAYMHQYSALRTRLSGTR